MRTLAVALLLAAAPALADWSRPGPITISGSPTPSVRSSTNENLTSAGTSYALNLPAGYQANDLLFALASYGIGSTTGHTLDTPNYTDASDTSITQADGSWHYKVANGSEGADDTLAWSTSSRASGITLAVQGTDGSPAVTCGTPVTGTNGSPNPPAVALTAPALVIAFYMTDNTSGVSHSADPSGFTHHSLQSFDSTSQAVGVATCQAATGTDCSSGNPGAFTLSGSEQWIAQTCIVEDD